MKAFKKVPVIILIMLGWVIFSLFMVGCKSYERTSEKSESRLFKDSDALQKKMDSIINNREISDRFSIPLPQANTGDAEKDELVNRELLNLVKRLSTQKSSGNNSYKMQYDEQTKALIFEAFIAATQDKKSVRKDSVSVIKDEFKSTENNSDKKVYVYPWWVYGIAILIVGYVVLRVAMFASPKLKLLAMSWKIANQNNAS